MFKSNYLSVREVPVILFCWSSIFTFSLSSVRVQSLSLSRSSPSSVHSTYPTIVSVFLQVPSVSDSSSMVLFPSFFLRSPLSDHGDSPGGPPWTTTVQVSDSDFGT